MTFHHARDEHGKHTPCKWLILSGDTSAHCAELYWTRQRENQVKSDPIPAATRTAVLIIIALVRPVITRAAIGIRSSPL
jgi:hypothetical protein